MKMNVEETDIVNEKSAIPAVSREKKNYKKIKKITTEILQDRKNVSHGVCKCLCMCVRTATMVV